VKFTGWLTQIEVYNYYRRSDIFVLPSIKDKTGWIEAQGLVVQEAQIHGLPVIASNIGGIPESVDNGKSGLLFRPGDSQNLSEGLRSLMENPAFARELGRRAKKYCQLNHSKSKIITKYNKLYQSILKKKCE
jgi:glycosyltransferase involved in cell wall biosynthesis